MSGAFIEICKHLTIEDYLSNIPQILISRNSTRRVTVSSDRTAFWIADSTEIVKSVTRHNDFSAPTAGDITRASLRDTAIIFSEI